MRWQAGHLYQRSQSGSDGEREKRSGASWEQGSPAAISTEVALMRDIRGLMLIISGDNQL